MKEKELIEIVETKTFTRRLKKLMDDEEYRNLQNFIIENPEAGDLIPGMDGLRKLRWPKDNKGKRGGFRVVYYWNKKEEQILMFFIFAKNEQIDLDPQQRRAALKITEEF